MNAEQVAQHLEDEGCCRVLADAYRGLATKMRAQAVVVERARRLVMGLKLDPVKNADGSPNEAWAGNRVAEAQAVIDALFDLGLEKEE